MGNTEDRINSVLFVEPARRGSSLASIA